MSSKSVVVIDTSMLCVWIKVPGMETCGPTADQWNFERINNEINAALQSGFTLVLPLASIIETGNHIAKAPSLRLETAKALCALIEKAAKKISPWAAFTEQDGLWSSENLMVLASEWPPLAQTQFSMGDVTIKKIADYYHEMGFDVRLLSGDQELASYEPPFAPLVPRRRQR